jgi:predicted phosphate transport protein (TIGR00153 family)
MVTLRLIPRDERFFELLIEDGENLLLAARALEAMLIEYDRLEERVSEIRALEHRGDEIDGEIATRLERAFVTPLDREDIHELTVHLDDVVDGIQSIAEIFLLYAIDRPTGEARQLAGILAAQALQLVEALRKLERLEGLDPHLREIHNLENEADGVSRAAIAGLFRKAADPIEVIKWRDVYHELEEAIDAAEDAAESIERTLHKGT